MSRLPTRSSGTAIVSFEATASIGRPGRDVAEQRQFDRAAAGSRRHHLDRPAAVPRALDEALFLQVGEVLVHRRQRREAEAAADFLEARRVAVLLDELVQVVEDFALPFGERKHAGLSLAEVRCDGTIRKRKAKVNSRSLEKPRQVRSC